MKTQKKMFLFALVMAGGMSTQMAAMEHFSNGTKCFVDLNFMVPTTFGLKFAERVFIDAAQFSLADNDKRILNDFVAFLFDLHKRHCCPVICFDLIAKVIILAPYRGAACLARENRSCLDESFLYFWTKKLIWKGEFSNTEFFDFFVNFVKKVSGYG